MPRIRKKAEVAKSKIAEGGVARLEAWIQQRLGLGSESGGRCFMTVEFTAWTKSEDRNL
jgi:hypothetical protein